LCNGDIISFGSAKIQFWLAPVKLRGLHLREAYVWLLLAAVTGPRKFSCCSGCSADFSSSSSSSLLILTLF